MSSKIQRVNDMSMKSLFSYKSLLLSGLVLNIALMIYVYFIVDGGPVSIRQHAGWVAILNEVPIVVLFYLAGIVKPYLMLWSKSKNNSDGISLAGTVMLTTTAFACLIIILAGKPLTKDLTLYINWAFLWGTSAYFVLIPKRITSSE